VQDAVHERIRRIERDRDFAKLDEVVLLEETPARIARAPVAAATAAAGRQRAARDVDRRQFAADAAVGADGV
jgi:hypothetical protein